MRPLVSVITVVRNDRPGFARTRASLRGQTCRDFEWLVADGGSVDGTADDVAAAAAAGEARWSRSAPDGGPFHAMNLAMAAVRGRYLLFLNAGDWLVDIDVFARLRPVLTGPVRADLVFGQSMECGAGGRFRLKRERGRNWIVYGMPTHHCAILYSREIIGESRYPDRYSVAADYAFTSAIVRTGANVVRWTAPISVFAPGGLSRQLAATGRMEQDAIRRDILRMPSGHRMAIRAAQSLAALVRSGFPWIYDILRYGITPEPVPNRLRKSLDPV